MILRKYPFIEYEVNLGFNYIPDFDSIIRQYTFGYHNSLSYLDKPITNILIRR